MKKLFPLLFLLLALPLWAETMLSDIIDDMTIDQSGNPFIVADNVIVSPEKKLTIGAGTVLLFKPFTGLIIEGSLIVEGSLANPVVFTSVNEAKYNPASDQPANPFDWNGILISRKAGIVKMSNFVLEYSVYGIKSQKEEFIISNGTFTNNGQFHVTVKDTIKQVIENTPFSFGTELENKPDEPKKSDSKTHWRKPVAIGCWAVGVAAIGAGGGLFYLSNRYGSKYESATTQVKMDDYLSKQNSALTGAVVCAIGGVVSAGCGTVFYFLKPNPKSPKKVTAAPILGTRNGIAIVVNF